MPYEFSIATNAAEVPTGPDWLHEAKCDGYRIMLIREQDRVRLISTGGYDWARRFPLIAEAAMRLRQSHFVIDGEAVVLDEDGVSGFAALHKHSEQAQLYAFDMLAGDGEDHRTLTLSLPKANLDRLLSRFCRLESCWRGSAPKTRRAAFRDFTQAKYAVRVVSNWYPARSGARAASS